MTLRPTFDELFSEFFPGGAQQAATPDLLGTLFPSPAAARTPRSLQDETHFSLRGVRYDLSP